MQLPGSSDCKIWGFSFPFSLVQDKHRDQASFILVAFTPFWQQSLEPDAGPDLCPVQALLHLQAWQSDVKLHSINEN